VNCDVPDCADCDNGDGVCYTCRSGFFRVVLDPPSNQDVVCLTGLGAYSIHVHVGRAPTHAWMICCPFDLIVVGSAGGGRSCFSTGAA
jgi:hypothetical protein